MVKGWRPGGTPGEAGSRAEALALRHLQAAGLSLVERNYRVARGPGARAGEVDLILLEPDGTLVFVEVRARSAPAAAWGGAAASISRAKQRRIVYAAQHWLMRLQALPACRFDVVAIDGDQIEWLRGAFDAS
jgi:putative endonuclease